MRLTDRLLNLGTLIACEHLAGQMRDTFGSLSLNRKHRRAGVGMFLLLERIKRKLKGVRHLALENWNLLSQPRERLSLVAEHARAVTHPRLQRNQPNIVDHVGDKGALDQRPP